jgi:uncharacterized membrane protein
VKRFPFLDWMRGLAVVVMIQCHVFNSLASPDVRPLGPYMLSQFIGGMAAPLFLFMAGMTFGFQMSGLDRREPSPLRRWGISLRRAGYILFIAYLFRFTNWVTTIPQGDWHELTKVDILNCMGLAMIVLSAGALFQGKDRMQFGAVAGALIAGAAPIVSNLSWDGVPSIVHEYLAPGLGRGRFAFFPCAAYVAFGLTMGAVVRGIAEEHLDRLMQWSLTAGLTLVFASHYLADIPYSIYPQSNFWTNSPALIFIRVGVILILLSASHLWTSFHAAGWSWMMCLGKNSLMVYWVHVVMVYGVLATPWKKALGTGWTAFAVVLVTLLMVGLSAAWLWWKGRRAAGLGNPFSMRRPLGAQH